jgi:hypothetical protein
MKKVFFTIAVISTMFSANAHAGQKQIIENERVKSHEFCVLKLGFAVNPMYKKGLKPTKVVDSAKDQMMIYTVRVGNKTGFFTCVGKQYKVWVETF